VIALQDLFIRGLKIEWDGIGADSYLRRIGSLHDLQELSFSRPVTFFAGENGTGKSTLLEGIAVAAGFNPEGGTKNYSFSTYDSHSELCDALTLIKGARKAKWGYFLRAESFYNVATAEEEYSRNGGTPLFLHAQSHGESFLTTAQENFRPKGIYLLDEQEAALSPQRQLTMIMEIVRCVEQGSQLIIATHSPILLAIPGAEILSFDGEMIHPCSYEDTESYKITEMFINDREHIMNMLLK
jgi:predicted ATPase